MHVSGTRDPDVWYGKNHVASGAGCVLQFEATLVAHIAHVLLHVRLPLRCISVTESKLELHLKQVHDGGGLGLHVVIS